MLIYISLEFHKAEILFFTETSELGESASLGDRKACFFFYIYIYDPPFLFSQQKTTQPHPQVFSVNGALTCKEAALLTSSVD